MKKSAIAIGAVAIFALSGTSAWAGSLTIPNAFTAGQAAVAADVNANFTATKTAVDDNDSRVTTNTASITTNAASITTNSTNITTNAGDVSTNTGSIASNTGNIGTNNIAIGTNTTSIGNNNTTIGTNTTNIGNNNTAIGTNTTNIGNNNTNIGTNTTNIGNNNTAIGNNATNIGTNTTDIATNVTDIATNVTDIATNVTDIATNVTDIATNVTAITALQSGLVTCPIDMVVVGTICVDIYEASVWSAAVAGTQYGDTDNSGGVGGGETAIPCAATGNDCTAGAANPIYARSVSSVTPVTQITWFQAQQACANVSKRLLTNAEWQMAAAGTPDPGLAGNDAANECNTNSAGFTVNTGASTGGTNQCRSNHGVYDMVGNVHEWVADWLNGALVNGTSGGTADATYGLDLMAQNTIATTQGAVANDMPAAVYRGGKFNAGTNAGVFAFSLDSAPSDSDAGIGFRCAR